MTQPLVSIISVNYRQAAITCELLASLENITYRNVEIWVVDNQSDGTLKKQISALYPCVNVIESKKNLGFAGGNNLAITQAKGQYLMFLNNDTEVSTGFLEPLIEVMESNPNIGICASKLHYYHHPLTIQYAGSSELHSLKIQSYAVGYGEKDLGQYDAIKPTNLAHGAAMMVRTSVLKDVGLMPEEFFLYYEEIDWCLKVKKEGYQIYFVPQSLVFHKESVTVGKQSAIQVYYKTRNRILLARRWRKGFGKCLSLTYLSLVALRDLSKFLFQRKFLLLSMYWDALSWNIKGNLK